MTKYYTVINENGRYLKFRSGSNGKTHVWVKGVKSASFGTENQMLSAIEQMKNSPYYNNLKLHFLGEATSGTIAKKNASHASSKD